jgi:hypothetical protein
MVGAVPSAARFVLFLPGAGLCLRAAIAGVRPPPADSAPGVRGCAHCRRAFLQATVSVLVLAAVRGLFICRVVAEDLVRRVPARGGGARAARARGRVGGRGAAGAVARASARHALASDRMEGPRRSPRRRA